MHHDAEVQPLVIWAVETQQTVPGLMKDEHELFMVLFVGTDLNFTRFQRVLCFAIIVAGTMFGNALMYQFATVDPGAPEEEKLLSQVMVSTGAAVCGGTFAAVAKLVFKRSGHRPLQEDEFIDRNTCYGNPYPIEVSC